MTHDHTDAVVVGRDHVYARRGRGLRLVPGFLVVLLAYIVVKFAVTDLRAPFIDLEGYRLSWIELLLTFAACVAMWEQVKVAKPGINNTTEVLLMGLIAIVQILLFALGAARVPALAMFNTTEFLLLTIINVVQTAVAYQINSSTLMRTISPTS